MSIIDNAPRRIVSDNQNDIARRVAIKEQIETLNQELELIDERIRQNFDYGDTQVGDWLLQLQRNRRLDPATIAARYPIAQYPHLYKAAPDTAALKQHIAPAELDAFYTDGRAKIVVK